MGAFRFASRAILALSLGLSGLAAPGCTERDPGKGPPLPPGLSLVETEEVPDAVLWQADFGALTPGPATDPAGVVYTRASEATTLHPLVASPAVSGFGENTARVVRTKDGATGLLFEGAATNLHASDAPWDGATWIGSPSEGSLTTHDIDTADPAGVMSVAKHAVLAGGNGRFDSATVGYPADIAGNLVISHMWVLGSGTFQALAFDGVLEHGASRELGGAWEHVTNPFIAAGRMRTIIPAEGRDATATGGTKAGPRSYRTARHMVEVGPRASSWIGASKTRAGAESHVASIELLAPNGRLCLEMEWVALYGSGALPWSPRLFTIDADHYAEIDVDTRAIRVVVGGVSSWVTAPITWAAGDTIALRLDVGDGPTTGTIQVGRGRIAAINDGRTLPPLPTAGAIALACDGPRAQLEGVHTRWRAWKRSPRHRTREVHDTAELVAALADTGGRARILMRGGVYRITAPLALTQVNSGLALAAYPGETPILDGGEVVTGKWVGPDDKGVYSIPYAGHSRQLWVNGTRATRARSPRDPEGWYELPNGFLAPSAAEAAKVGDDGEIVGRHLWRMFRVGVAAVKGPEIEARERDWANAQSMGPYFDLDAVWWAEGKGYVGDEEGSFWHDRAAGRLYYRPRSGEDMGTAEVVAGVVERAISVSGTLELPARDITISGITVRHTTWTAPDDLGASTLQSSIMWTSGVAGDGFEKLPAAILAVGAQRLTITGCTISGIGSDAVSFEIGTQDSAVLDCSISDVAGAGVSVGDVTHFHEDPWPNDPRAVLARNVVANNLIRAVAQDYQGSDAIFAGYTSGLVVARNDIDGTPYTAVAIGWGWGYNDPPGVDGSGWPVGIGAAPTRDTPLGNNRVVRNRITSFLRALDDGGAIYALAKQQNGGRTVIAGNHIVSSPGSGVNQAGVYLDNGCAGVDVRANLFENMQDAFVRMQASVTPFAFGNTLIGNYADSGFYTGSPDNTERSNVIGALGPEVGAIKAGAGRIPGSR